MAPEPALRGSPDTSRPTARSSADRCPPAGELSGDRRLTTTFGGGGAARQVLALQRAAGNRAVASALSKRVQRQTPAPAPSVSPPSPAPPGQGPAPSESAPVLLPAPGASLLLPLSSERRFPITKEDLSEFNIGVGEHATDEIPLGESGILAKVAIGSESPVSLSDASLVLSPIVGQLDAGDVAKTRGAEEKGSTAGKSIGRGVGILGGPLGSIVGEKLGEEIGGWATGDHFVRFTLKQGALGGSFRVTYNPYLKLTLTVAGFSWLLNATATLQTNLNLVVAPKVDFAGSELSLIFRGGRLAHTEFDLKPAVAPALELIFDANGQLRAAVNLLPILGNDRKNDAPVDDEGIELAEVVTAPFNFLEYKTVIGGGGVDIHAAKGSPFEVLKKNAKAAGKMPAAVQEFVVKSKKKMPFTPPPPDIAGPPRTGRTPDKAIPFVWYKPFNRYIPTLNLPTSEFGKRHAARRFPSTRYKDEKRGSDIKLGVDNWPYKGMVLRKKSNDRGGEVPEFREQCALHGINLPPGYQIDHVIDLVFEGGHDEFHNLWPLLADVNTRAGGMWSNGRSLVQWRDREIDPPVRSAPSAVPTNRYFVISDIQDPPG